MNEKTMWIWKCELNVLITEPHLGGGERMTFKRVMDFVKDKGDQNLREINQKLQRMLEETLTKNMHLQQVSHYPLAISH